MKLFLDTSTTSTGWVVTDNDFNIVDYGTIIPSKKNNIDKRIIEITDTIELKIKELKIKEVYCEDLTVTDNFKYTAKPLCGLLYLIKYLAIKNGCEFSLVAQSTWKKEWGFNKKYYSSFSKKEKKKLIFNMAKDVFPDIEIKTSDLADALFIMYYFKNKL